LGFDWFWGNTLIGGGKIGTQGGTAPSFQGRSSAANPSGFFPGPSIPTGDPFTPFIGGISPSGSDTILTSGLSGNSGIPAVATITGILTDPQFRVVIRALEQRSGIDILSSPRVTTLSGRQTQISVLDLIRIVTDVDLDQQGSGGTSGNNNNNNSPGVIGSTIEYTTQTLPFGPVLDVLPSVSADGFSIQMTIIPTVTEFVGYDDPGQFVPQAQSVGGANVGIPITAQLPLPRFRLRQVTTSCNVWDGQTVLLGGLITDNVSKFKDKVPLLGDLPFLGRLFRSEGSSTSKRNLMIFVTPTIIDAAGNRVHTDEEMPFSRTSVPVQPTQADNQ
jgi:general secretion pathway protein D